ncbi:MAG: hypothetical protein GY849_24430, partial [Deltaproteobacteria bacterium]|nr:hypothetical protein [Deltaproteobacteria bacterium]
ATTNPEEAAFAGSYYMDECDVDYEDSPPPKEVEEEEEKEKGNVSGTQNLEEGEVSDSIASSDDGSFDPDEFLKEVELPYFWDDSVSACNEQYATVWMPSQSVLEELRQASQGHTSHRGKDGIGLFDCETITHTILPSELQSTARGYIHRGNVKEFYLIKFFERRWFARRKSMRLIDLSQAWTQFVTNLNKADAKLDGAIVKAHRVFFGRIPGMIWKLHRLSEKE